MRPYPRAGHTFVVRQARFIGEQGDGSTKSRPHFIVRVTSFKDAYYLISSYTINHNSMLHYTDALSGQHAMTTALVLEADGRRENGRWKRGSIDIGTSANISDSTDPSLSNPEDPQNVAN